MCVTTAASTPRKWIQPSPRPAHLQCNRHQILTRYTRERAACAHLIEHAGRRDRSARQVCDHRVFWRFPAFGEERELDRIRELKGLVGVRARVRADGRGPARQRSAGAVEAWRASPVRSPARAQASCAGLASVPVQPLTRVGPAGRSISERLVIKTYVYTPRRAPSGVPMGHRTRGPSSLGD